MDQRAFDRSDWQIGQESKCRGGFIEFPKFREHADLRFVEFTPFVELLDMSPGGLETGRIGAQLRLNLIRSLLDHLPDQFGLPAIDGLKFEPYCFRSSLEQRQQVFPRNFRTRPHQQRKFAVVLGTRDQFRITKLRKSCASIRRSTDDHSLVSALNKNVGDAFAEAFALGNGKQMVLTLCLCTGNEGLIVKTFRAAQQGPCYVN